jgi:sec-independent protein translocase protein TatA
MFEGLFQPMHLLVLLFICLLIFGPKKLADLGKGLGEGIRGFKEAIKDEPAAAPSANSQDSSRSAATAETKSA